jgi:hypothetical protein
MVGLDMGAAYTDGVTDHGDARKGDDLLLGHAVAPYEQQWQPSPGSQHQLTSG